jgi:hypothetical protein
MQPTFHSQPKIEPFEFQNRTIYRDLLRMMNTVRESQQEVKTELGKMFLHNLFNTTFSISKDIGYSTLDEDPLSKMGILSTGIAKMFDCMTALDVCFEAHWIPSLQYFECKQILEKAYWTLQEDQKSIIKTMNAKFSEIDSNNIKQFQ